jgi:hypothetical protein
LGGAGYGLPHVIALRFIPTANLLYTFSPLNAWAGSGIVHAKHLQFRDQPLLSLRKALLLSCHKTPQTPGTLGGILLK